MTKSISIFAKEEVKEKKKEVEEAQQKPLPRLRKRRGRF
jgi:hypothetical protein